MFGVNVHGFHFVFSNSVGTWGRKKRWKSCEGGKVGQRACQLRKIRQGELFLKGLGDDR